MGVVIWSARRGGMQGRMDEKCRALTAHLAEVLLVRHSRSGRRTSPWLRPKAPPPNLLGSWHADAGNTARRYVAMHAMHVRLAYASMLLPSHLRRMRQHPGRCMWCHPTPHALSRTACVCYTRAFVWTHTSPYTSLPRWPTEATCMPRRAAAIMKLQLPPTSQVERSGGERVSCSSSRRRRATSGGGSFAIGRTASTHRLPRPTTSHTPCAPEAATLALLLRLLAPGGPSSTRRRAAALRGASTGQPRG